MGSSNIPMAITHSASIEFQHFKAISKRRSMIHSLSGRWVTKSFTSFWKSHTRTECQGTEGAGSMFFLVFSEWCEITALLLLRGCRDWCSYFCWHFSPRVDLPYYGLVNTRRYIIALLQEWFLSLTPSINQETACLNVPSPSAAPPCLVPARRCTITPQTSP